MSKKEEKIQELADKFFKERDCYAFNNDGTLTDKFKHYLKEEHNLEE